MTVTDRVPAARAATSVQATINYVAPMDARPLFHAQDHSRDNLIYDSQVMAIHDARAFPRPPSLDREGVVLARHPTAVTNFRDPAQIQGVYLAEMEQLILQVTGAAWVGVIPGGGLVRFAERSPHFGTGMNTQPARFPHIDFTRGSAPGLARDGFGGAVVALKPGQRLVGYNIWRATTQPPQDVPLAVCDRSTVAPADLVVADGVYDEGDPSTWWTSEALLLRHNPAHRWLYFRDLHPDEVMIFHAYDNDPVERPATPHSAFEPNRSSSAMGPPSGTASLSDGCGSGASRGGATQHRHPPPTPLRHPRPCAGDPSRRCT